MEADRPWAEKLPGQIVAPALAAIVGLVDIDLVAHDLEVRTLLSLPFLEWVAHPMRRELTSQLGKNVDLNERLVRDIRMHRLVRARRDGQGQGRVVSHYRQAGCGDEFVRFLTRWVEGGLDTIDSAVVSVPTQYSASVVVLSD
ncbi:hypothetical protein [Micromonospora inyonensis]|uniref:Uncharacterized protein n=1 Tax=Micromonospora inyonensis TaxID=47866 RepID=A0A1C6SNT2_9ACTN|nr:hypothetical protein [Micromonospora inyonensis]SCL31097.1 hypothetical protein GA0074694_5883 [Micromonospora inyonensis]